jgi:mannosyltransferase OCH1-like enzyme
MDESRVIPKIVHQTATTKLLSPEEERLRHRTKRLLPDWEMRLWDDRDNACLMESHLPQFSVRFQNIKRGIVRADIARCLYMHAFGGLYLDTDYKLTRPIPNELLRNACILPASRDADSIGPGFRIGNAVLASEPGHEFWKSFLTEIFDNFNLENLPESLVEQTTGPEGLTDFYLRHREFHSRLFIPDQRLFHPKITCHGISYDRSAPSYGTHLCWGSWRSKKLLPKIKTLLVRKLTSF